MNVKFLNPFIEAAYKTLRAEAGVEVKRGQLALQKQVYVSDDVTVVISLIGHVEGIVFYAMSEGTALGIASAMLGETMPSFNGLAQSGIAEMGNVITGMASVKLADAGFEANISPPALIQGSGARISTMDFARIVVPLQSSVGLLNIHLALREGARRGVASENFRVPNKPIG